MVHASSYPNTFLWFLLLDGSSWPLIILLSHRLSRKLSKAVCPRVDLPEPYQQTYCTVFEMPYKFLKGPDWDVSILDSSAPNAVSGTFEILNKCLLNEYLKKNSCSLVVLRLCCVCLLSRDILKSDLGLVELGWCPRWYISDEHRNWC